MANMYEQILTSDLFTFIVGERREHVIVHSEAIARLSPSLGKLVHGSLLEAQTKTAELVDIDHADFVRLCQFAYTGDYAPPQFTEEAELSNAPANDGIAPRKKEEAPAPSRQNSAYWGPVEVDGQDYTDKAIVDFEVETEYRNDFKCRRCKKKKGSHEDYHEEAFQTPLPPPHESKKAKLRKAFESRVYEGHRNRHALENLCKTVGNSSPKQNFTPVLLAHARLYTVGDKYGIDSLTSLALQKLHNTLIQFHLYESRIADIVQLVRYTYENTQGYRKDPLRTMVAEYVVGEIDIIGKSPHFYSLLKDGGEFVVDFWRLTQQHLL